jgi:hypothetical protein
MFLEKFIKREKAPVKAEVVEETVKKVEKVEEKYSPRLGDANRYENARSSNKDLAESINKEALNTVNQAVKVLDMLERDPNQANFHSAIAGDRWNIHYLGDVETKLTELYGDNDVARLTNIPPEVVSFLKRYRSFIYRNAQSV